MLPANGVRINKQAATQQTMLRPAPRTRAQPAPAAQRGPPWPWAAAHLLAQAVVGAGGGVALLARRLAPAAARAVAAAGVAAGAGAQGAVVQLRGREARKKHKFVSKTQVFETK